MLFQTSSKERSMISGILKIKMDHRVMENVSSSHIVGLIAMLNFETGCPASQPQARVVRCES